MHFYSYPWYCIIFARELSQYSFVLQQSVAYPGFQRGKVRPDTESGGGGGPLQVRDMKTGGGGGGGQSASGPMPLFRTQKIRYR